MLLLSGCAQTLTSVNDVHKLPVSRGLNGGTYFALSPWKYLGSNRSCHEFDYYYHIDNLLRHREIHVPRSLAVLHFPESSEAGQWATLRLEDDKLHFHFYRSRLIPGTRSADQPGLL